MLHVRLFPDLASDRWGKIDLNEEIKKLNLPPGNNPALDPAWCAEQMTLLHQMLDIDYSYGGFLEDRSVLWRGHYHEADGAFCHLGTDYNVPTRSLVHLPEKGKLVLAEQDPDQNGGWGGRSIWEIRGHYVIFAHMYRLHGLIGQEFDADEPIGEVAPPPFNGHWFPHLHVQVMTKYDRNVDGYSAPYPGMEMDFLDPEEFFGQGKR